MRSRFEDLDFEGFKELARDPSLSLHEKVGFPDSYRAGKEKAILRDIAGKLTNLRRKNRAVVDIGPGCGAVAVGLVDLCRRRGHRLTLIDSAEMLALLPADPADPDVARIAGRFPEDCRDFLTAHRGRVDAILVYSVLQYVFAEGNAAAFLDRALELLADGGQLLLGDIPNQSMRRRFFRSEAGIRCHQEFTGTRELPQIESQVAEPGKIDDDALLALVERARAAGFHAWLVPQAPALPMANRREDLLIVKP